MQPKLAVASNQTTTSGHNKNHSPLGHTLMMVACCALPVLIFAIFSFLKIENIAINKLTWLICPIGMILMLGVMLFNQFRTKKSNNQGNDEQKSCH